MNIALSINYFEAKRHRSTLTALITLKRNALPCINDSEPPVLRIISFICKGANNWLSAWALKIAVYMGYDAIYTPQRAGVRTTGIDLLPT